jgi:signal transduction histidine kinase/DNA-binding response OmpR family regulator/CHASE3 domain sensor protein
MKNHVSKRRPKSLMRQLSIYLIVMGLLLLAPLIMLYTAAVIVINNRTNLDAQRLTIQGDIDSIQSSMLDQETGLRGYVLTAQTSFLQPFQTGRPAYLLSLHDFQLHIQNQPFPDVARALDGVETASNTWYETFALPEIANVQSGKLTLARSILADADGKTLFDRFRTATNALVQAVGKDFTQEQKHASSTGSLLALGSLFLAVLTVALLWFLAFRFSKTLRVQLISLKMASQRFAEGQLSTRARPLPSIELNDVGQTFNQMANVLQEQQSELTERNRRLNAANNTFRALLDSTDDAILYVTADGQIRDANRRLVDQWKDVERSSDHIRDIPIMEYVSAVKDQMLNPDEYVSFMERALADTEQDFSFALPRSLPEPGDYAVFSTPVRGEQGEYIGRFFSIRDVTHEKAVDRMKSEFVSLVSHELRTPLTSIKGYIDLLLREPGQLDEMQRESLEIAQKNARRLVALINDLLDLSHLEEGKVVLRRTMFDVQTIIKDVIQLFQTQLQSREQTLVTNFSPLPSLVIGDPERVAQIFMNLLSNAHKYTPVGGRIEVTVQQAARQVQVAIHDNGIGMSAEEQRKLFTRFYRVKNHITQEAGGTGLGLAITKTLIEMHNGDIQVSSAPGEGSTFTFTLPLVQEQIVQPVSRPSASPGKRLLLVEDDPDQVSLYHRYLTEYGYDVLIASTGKSAIQLAETAQPDLICLDIILPDITGLQVLEQLKSQPTTADIPVLILSITDDNGEAQLLGAVDHVRKPISQHDLLQLIHATMKDRNKPLVLVAESDAVSRVLIVESLQQAGFRVIETFNAETLVSLVAHHRPNLIVSNVDLLFVKEPCTLSELLQTCAAIKASLLVVGMFPQSLHEQMKELMKAVIVHSIGNPANIHEVIAAAKEMPTRK